MVVPDLHSLPRTVNYMVDGAQAATTFRDCSLIDLPLCTLVVSKTPPTTPHPLHIFILS